MSDRRTLFTIRRVLAVCKSTSRHEYGNVEADIAPSISVWQGDISPAFQTGVRAGGDIAVSWE